MDQPPPRPSAVPEDAVWAEDEGVWELVERSPDGQRTGPYRAWRVDGPLLMETRYADGHRVGPFRRFHADGRIAREGTYRDDRFDGVVVAHANPEGGGEPLRGCCVPAGAKRMRARYEDGRLMGETFFDGEDRPLCSDGSLRPLRPAGIPDDVEFEEHGRRWRQGRYDPEHGRCLGVWRWWDTEGRLSEEATYDEGVKTLRRRFDPAGKVIEEIGLGRDEIPDGPFLRRWTDAHEGGHADARVRGVDGCHADGLVVGRWLYRDDAGAVVRQVDHGTRWAGDDGETSEAFANVDRPAAAWASWGASLAEAGRVREALVAWARMAGVSGDPAGLIERIQERVVALTEERAREMAVQAAEPETCTPAALLDALLRGGEAASILRSLAGQMAGKPRTARDLIEAAVLLAPQRMETYATRALVRLDLGDREGAMADAARVAVTSDGTAEFLRQYAAALFPAFAFWPSAEDPPELPEPLPIEPAQPLENVRWAVQMYASRLAGLREAIRTVVGQPQLPAWAPPSVDGLLPLGPVELRREDAAIEDESDEGVELTTVRIDETLPQAFTVPELMRLARTSWAGLTWLCWSVGLDQVAIPQGVEARPEYPRALAMSLSRAFRANDCLVTGGLRAMTQGIPGFRWEGIEVDELPPSLVQMAAAEWLEVRAVLLWLSNPGNLSPFQDDLRRV